MERQQQQQGAQLFVQTIREKTNRASMTDKKSTASMSSSSSMGGKPPPAKKQSFISGIFQRRKSSKSNTTLGADGQQPGKGSALPPRSPLLGGGSPKSAESSPPPPLPEPIHANNNNNNNPNGSPLIQQQQRRNSVSHGALPQTEYEATVFTSGPAVATPRSRTQVESRQPATREGRSTLVENAVEHESRPRTPSMTNIDNVYGRLGRPSGHNDRFEFGNPLLESSSQRAPSAAQQQRGLAQTPSAAELDAERAKRASLYNTASHNVDQSKLLERRPTRAGRSASVEAREAPKLSPPPPSPAGDADDREAGSNDVFVDPPPYDRDAFSAPGTSHSRAGSSVNAMSPKLSARVIRTASTASVTSSTAGGGGGGGASTSSSPAMRRDSFMLATQPSLRSRRASSRQFHDEQQGAERARLVQQLGDFFAQMGLSGVTDPKVHAQFLLERYSVGDVALALLKHLGRIPPGWDEHLPRAVAQERCVVGWQLPSSFDGPLIRDANIVVMQVGGA